MFCRILSCFFSVSLLCFFGEEPGAGNQEVREQETPLTWKKMKKVVFSVTLIGREGHIFALGSCITFVGRLKMSSFR